MVPDTSNDGQGDSVTTGNRQSEFLRRVKKPLIERKRRERINRNLAKLKILLLENLRKQGGTQTSKLDKADILDMAVNYITTTQQQEYSLPLMTQYQYAAGFQDCAQETLYFLALHSDVTPDLTSRLREHVIQVAQSKDYFLQQLGYNHLSKVLLENSDQHRNGPVMTSTPNRLDKNWALMTQQSLPTSDANYYQCLQMYERLQGMENASIGTICDVSSSNAAPVKNDDVSDIKGDVRSDDVNCIHDGGIPGRVWQPWKF